jgi:hypothetical protein
LLLKLLLKHDPKMKKPKTLATGVYGLRGSACRQLLVRGGCVFSTGHVVGRFSIEDLLRPVGRHPSSQSDREQ